ncbi:MAG: TrmH family RNA methyltransferase [Leptolyngbyaceae cyanobacterium]
MSIEQKLALTKYLEDFVTAERRSRIDAVLAQRTRYITVVAEDFHNAHNASAILRTCEGLGIQDIHVVENFNTFKARRGAASGSKKWVTVHHYDSDTEDNTQSCLKKLRSQGYLLVATSPHGEALPPEVLPLDQKLAILFGSERYGLSTDAQSQADLQLTIPMVGFMESLNVSVSAALCLYTLTQRLRMLDVDWPLSDREKLDLRLDWMRYSARHSDRLEQRFLSTHRREFSEH